MDYKNELDKIQEDINNKKVEKAKLEERLKTLQEESDNVVRAVEEMDINIENLDTNISELEAEIKEELEKCQSSLK